MKLVIALVVMFLNVSSASAWVTGTKLSKICSGSPYARPNTCSFFIVGAIEGFRAGADLVVWKLRSKTKIINGAPIVGICPANGTNNEQYVEVVVKYIEVNPDKHHLEAVRIVRDALVEAFPCTDRE